MTTLEILKAARKLITPRKRWTQRAFARVAQGCNSIGSQHPTATCWCTIGGMQYVAADDNAAYLSAVTALADVLPKRGDMYDDDAIVEYNDMHSHRSVLRLMDKAIAKLEAGE